MYQVTSPGYPKKYHAGYNLNCTYYFAAESGHLGHIQFKDVDLNGDYVKVYDGWNPLERRAIGMYVHENLDRLFCIYNSHTKLQKNLGPSSLKLPVSFTKKLFQCYW